MDRYVIDEGNFDSTIASELAHRLILGEVGLLPTDTVYGFMCTFDNAKGKELIYRIKDRDQQKKMQILIASISDLDLLDIPSTVEIKSIAKNFWPGPLTIVVPDKSNNLVGIRIPNHRFVRLVIEETGKPLASTSANRSGSPPVTIVDNIGDNTFSQSPHFVVDGGKISGSSSTVVRIDHDTIELLRTGSISLAEIENSLIRDRRKSP